MSNIMRRLSIAVVAVLAVALAVSSGASEGWAQAPSRSHPAVGVFMEQHPGESVPVIVQTSGSLSQVEQDLARMGATGVRELGMVGAVAANVPPGQVHFLSADPDVDLVSLDAVMLPTGAPAGDEAPASTFTESVNAGDAWGAGVTGEGVTIAVIDSGLASGRDFAGRVAGSFEMSSLTNKAADENGHGTYVSGIMAGGSDDYSGIAPGARVLSLKVAGREGAAFASDVIAALQWTVDHKDHFGIRVVNLSLTSSVADSYRQDPLSAAAEQAWFHGIVVVTSAGNFGSEPFAVDRAPGNDPFVISVGAFDEAGTSSPSDDSAAAWSSRGVTVDGYAKPEVMAPGVDIISTLARGSFLARDAAGPGDGYIALSGTSASAAIVSGAVALMLDEEPGLTPDQVKFRLIATGGALDGSAAPRVDAYAAMASELTGSANGNAVLNDLIDPETGDIVYDSVLWRSVLWRSVLWRSIESSVLWRA